MEEAQGGGPELLVGPAVFPPAVRPGPPVPAEGPHLRGGEEAQPAHHEVTVEHCGVVGEGAGMTLSHASPKPWQPPLIIRASACFFLGGLQPIF